MEVVTANRTHTHGGAKPKSLSRGCGKAEENSAQETLQRSFLNYQFEPLPIFDVRPIIAEQVEYRIEDGEPQLLLANEKIEIASNIINLHKAAEAYCKVHGGAIPEERNTDPLRQLQSLYQAMIKCKPVNNEIGIDFDYNSRELKFYEYGWCDYPSGSLAFFTLSFLDYMEDPYRQFFKEVISLARITMQAPCPEEHFDLAYAVGYFDADYIDEMLADDPEYAQMVKSYQEGHINDLVMEVCKTPWHLACSEDFDDRVEHLMQCTNDNALKEFVEVAAKGVKLMANEDIAKYRHNLHRCEIDEFDESECYEETLGIDRITALCYGDEDTDPVVRVAIDCLNNEGCNFSQEELYEMCEIDECYNKPLNVSDFLTSWFNWFEKYNHAKWKYEQTHANDERHVFAQDGNSCL